MYNLLRVIHTHLLSDYFLLSACPLLSTNFLAVSCYKRMCLTISAYGIQYVNKYTFALLGYEPGCLERLVVSHPNLCDASCTITKEDRLKLRVTVKHSERQLTPIALP